MFYKYRNEGRKSLPCGCIIGKYFCEEGQVLADKMVKSYAECKCNQSVWTKYYTAKEAFTNHITPSKVIHKENVLLNS